MTTKKKKKPTNKKKKQTNKASSPLSKANDVSVINNDNSEDEMQVVQDDLSSAAIGEVEVLESIYGNDLARLEPVWGRPHIAIVVRPYVSSSGLEVMAKLDIVYTKNYPAVAPNIKITDVKGISDENKKNLEQEIRRECQRLAGKESEPFIYNLMNLVQDFLVNHRANTAKSFYDEFMEKETLKSKALEEERLKEVEKKKREAETLKSRVHDALDVNKQFHQSPVKKQLWPTFSEDNEMMDGDNGADIQIDTMLMLEQQTNSRYLQDFEEIKTLGFGGFGKVAKCRNRLDGLYYAVKRIKLQSNDMALNRKVLREVRSLALMFHQYIVRYFQAWIEDDQGDLSDIEDDEEDEFGDSYGFIRTRSSENFWINEDSDSQGVHQQFLERNTSDTSSKMMANHRVLYIQMEYCPGQTLREVIDKKLLVENIEWAWKLFRQIVEALYYIHNECHVIHRDLKPANVFLDSGGNVKLGDFGLAVNYGQQQQNPEPENIAEGSMVEDLTNDNTSGVGTTLYRAPEAQTSKYNEKADMFSLGILFYEMLVPPFETGMERIRVLTELRETGRSTTHPTPSRQAEELIQSLLAQNPEERPSAKEILESPVLPKKIETEERYFSEVMTVVRSVDRSSPLYNRLMLALFEHQRPELFYAYDFLGGQNLKKQEQRSKVHDATMWTIFHAMEHQFKLYGAVSFHAPLLTPKTNVNDKLGLISQQQCQFMDPQGRVVLLPINLTLPFARWVSLHQSMTFMKRYDCSHVYHSSVGQPNARLQACIDSIVPALSVSKDLQFSKFWHADFLLCCKKALLETMKLTEHHQNAVINIYIQDYDLQQRALRRLGMSKNSDKDDQDVIAFLDGFFSQHMQWTNIRRACLDRFSQKQTDALRPFFIHSDPNNSIDCFHEPGLEGNVELVKYLTRHPTLNAQFRPWLFPMDDMNSGLFFVFAISMANQQKKPHTSSTKSMPATTPTSSNTNTVCSQIQSQQENVCVAITGGRYDNLIQHYRLSSSLKTKHVAALGARFHLERLATQCVFKLSSIQVLVGAPSDEEPTSLEECYALAHNLREHGIRAEWNHPFLHNPVISENFLAYCKRESIPYFVNIKRKTCFRIRSGLKTMDKEFNKIESLLTFLQSNLE